MNGSLPSHMPKLIFPLFEVGGHSLLATQVIARLRSTLRIEVPLRCLFEAPTLAEFATRITEMLLQEMEELSEDGT